MAIESKETSRGWIIEGHKHNHGPVWFDYKNPSYPKVIDSPENAQLFPSEINEKILVVYRKIIDHCNSGHMKLNGIHHTSIKFVEMFVRTQDVDLKSDRHLHERQMLAIEKLALDEVEALGVEKYAVFVKLEKPPKKRKKK